jgi:hypothetical protein
MKFLLREKMKSLEFVRLVVVSVASSSASESKFVDTDGDALMFPSPSLMTF